MTKNSVGEVKLRRIIHRGEKAIALEIRTPHDKRWGNDTIYSLRKDVHNVDTIPAVIEKRLNYLLDIGYVFVCCRDHEWERGDYNK